MATNSRYEPHSAAGPVPDPPTLEERYSGIPERLLDKARKTKKQTFQNQTKGLRDLRTRLPVLPQGVNEGTFNQAIEDLRNRLGADNVVINDQPLSDGWYVNSQCRVSDQFNLNLTDTSGTWSVS